MQPACSAEQTCTGVKSHYFDPGALSTPEQRVVPVPSDDEDIVKDTVGDDQRSLPEEQAATNRRSEALKPPGQGKSEYVGVTPFKNGRWKAECSHGAGCVVLLCALYTLHACPQQEFPHFLANYCTRCLLYCRWKETSPWHI